LAQRSIDPDNFRLLVENLVEVVFCSFYAAANDYSSSSHLIQVFRITGAEGIEPPSLDLFRKSRFVDGHGWGNQLTVTERDEWRRGSSAM
jgi:hypothetical protein